MMGKIAVSHPLYRGILWLLAFLVVQVSISILLKLAAGMPEWRMTLLVVGGGVLPFLSTFLLMRVFAYMPGHLAQGLGIGISFLLSQLALAAIAHTRLSMPQFLGIGIIVAGMFLLANQSSSKSSEV